MARKKVATPGQNSDAAHELLSIIDRLERLEGQKRDIAEDIRDVKGDAKARGYDLKAIEKILKERAETDEQKRRRQETDDIADVYRAALGMLDGTPLGESARKRLSQPTEGEEQAPEASETPETSERSTTITPEDIAAAKEAGKQAFRDGQRVIANPYVAGDPRRAAWDEGWCFEAGSDGMDIPAAWRRTAKKKPADDESKKEDAA